MATVYVFEVEDSAADSWTSQMAVIAESQSAGGRSLRDAGLHKKQIQNQGRPVSSAPTGVEPFGSLTPGGFMRRRLNDSGWSDWELLTPDQPLNWKDDRGAPRTR